MLGRGRRAMCDAAGSCAGVASADARCQRGRREGGTKPRRGGDGRCLWGREAGALCIPLRTDTGTVRAMLPAMRRRAGRRRRGCLLRIRHDAAGTFTHTSQCRRVVRRRAGCRCGGTSTPAHACCKSTRERTQTQVMPAGGTPLHALLRCGASDSPRLLVLRPNTPVAAPAASPLTTAHAPLACWRERYHTRRLRPGPPWATLSAVSSASRHRLGAGRSGLP